MGNIPSEEKTLKTLENHLGKSFRVRESDFWGEKTKLSRERDREKWILEHTEPIYWGSVNLDR